MINRRIMAGCFVSLLVLFSGAISLAQEDGHGGFDGESRPESDRESPVALNPEGGMEIGLVYEAYLSPQQEGGEEEETPRFVPDIFKSTEPSIDREERPARAHAVIEFTQDLSRAYVHLAIANLNPDDIVMMHLHCGRPGILGPIIIDFSLIGDYQSYLEDGVMTIEITNADIESVIDNGEGLVGAFTGGCPILLTNPLDKIKTIGGLEYVADQGDLYFNIHTAAQTFFGDIRGAFYPVNIEN